MKSIITLLFALLIFSAFQLSMPTTAHANSFFDGAGDGFGSIFHRFDNWFRNWDRDWNRDDDELCHLHPEFNGCHPSVPEFGLIPGAIALLSSGGTFLFLKKRPLKS